MKQIGIYTKMYGDASLVTYPLPLREEGADGVGRGRAAGHSVQLVDWAYVAELMEQRRQHSNTTLRTYHRLYPMGYATAASADGSPSSAVLYGSVEQTLLSCVHGLFGAFSRFLKPDARPAREFDGWPDPWRYESVLPAWTEWKLMKVDDVRRAFYDLKNASRIYGSVENFCEYGDGGSWDVFRPHVDYGWENGGFVKTVRQRDAIRMECRTAGGATTLPAFLWVASEVASSAGFSVRPAYAVLRKFARHRHNGQVVEWWEKFVCADFALSGDASAPYAQLDLSGLGCDAAGVWAFMEEKVGSFQADDSHSYEGWAQGMALVFDVAFPLYSPLFVGWSWTPAAA